MTQELSGAASCDFVGIFIALSQAAKPISEPAAAEQRLNPAVGMGETVAARVPLFGIQCGKTRLALLGSWPQRSKGHRG